MIAGAIERDVYGFCVEELKQRKPVMGEYKFTRDMELVTHSVLIQMKKFQRSKKKPLDDYAFRLKMIDTKTGNKVNRGLTIDYSNGGERIFLSRCINILEQLSQAGSTEERRAHFIEYLTLAE